MTQLTTLEPKDPHDVIDYSIDWSNWLQGDDTVLLSEWLVPDGITMDLELSDTTSATIWLSGGTTGTEYQLTNRITTAQGRQRDRTITIRVREL
jgi:RNA-binding protein YlmH